MSFNLDDVNIGGQLHVGTGVYAAIKEGRDKMVQQLLKVQWLLGHLIHMGQQKLP